MKYPGKTVDLITKIDGVIQRLHNKRLGYYEVVSKKYHDIKAMYYRSTKRAKRDVSPPSFEAFISADMRRELEVEFDPSAVFMEFPGIEQDKIDIYVEAKDAHAYIENKMYYSPGKDGRNNHYRHDFEKIRALVELESSMGSAVGFLVHFQLYENAAFPAHALYEKFASELDSKEWWSEIKLTDKKRKKHFARLLFGKKA